MSDKLLGSPDTGDSIKSAGGYIRGFKFTCDTSGTVTSIKVKVSGATDVKAAIYTDSGGHPSALLSGNATGVAAGGAGWVEVGDLSASVTQGTGYWLLTLENEAHSESVRLNAESWPYEYKAQAYADLSSWPNPITGMTEQDGYKGWIQGWGAILYTKSLSGTLTISGVVSSKFLKSLAGTITPTGALGVKIFVSLAGTLTIVGNLARQLPLRTIVSFSNLRDIVSATGRTIVSSNNLRAIVSAAKRTIQNFTNFRRIS